MVRKTDYVIRITLNEIKYDVKFESWRTDKVQSANSSAATLLAYEDDRAEDWLIRQIHDAIGTVYSELRWCTHDASRFMTDEILYNPEEWTLHLRFGKGWRGSLRAMTSMLHDYVRDYVLGRWYLICKPELAPNYLASADAHLARLYNEARSEIVQLEPFRL